MKTKRKIPQFKDGDFKVSPMCDLSQPSPQCVRIAHKGGVVAVRSSQSGDKTLLFDNGEWRAFVQGVKSGAFDV